VVICVEDLQVKNMTASAAGTREAPGRKVKAKSGLNRSILDQGWSEFRRQLGYKLAWRGGELVLVPPQYTSQTCPNCGHVSAENRKTQEAFRCVRCCYGNHADLVGAINILRAGQSPSSLPSERCGNVAGNRNPPRGGAMSRPVGISGLQAGEDVKELEFCPLACLPRQNGAGQKNSGPISQHFALSYLEKIASCRTAPSR
jgi:putative transposase